MKNGRALIPAESIQRRILLIRGQKVMLDEVVTNCDHLSSLRFSPMLPHAFTEYRILMLSSVLHSKRAVQVNIAIMRAFVKLREMLSAHTEFCQKLAELERKLESHDGHIRSLFDAIRQLMAPPEPKPRRIGFRTR